MKEILIKNSILTKYHLINKAYQRQFKKGSGYDKNKCKDNSNKQYPPYYPNELRVVICLQLVDHGIPLPCLVKSQLSNDYPQIIRYQ